jgi:hypothetical protein
VGAPDDPAAGRQVQSERAVRLLDLLGLTEDELCAVLSVDPLTLLSGQLEHRPELPILLDLLAEAEERAGASVLRRWVRAAGPSGRPIDALLARDFAAFEDALGQLAERGFVLRGGGGGPRGGGGGPHRGGGGPRAGGGPHRGGGGDA